VARFGRPGVGQAGDVIEQGRIGHHFDCSCADKSVGAAGRSACATFCLAVILAIAVYGFRCAVAGKALFEVE